MTEIPIIAWILIAVGAIAMSAVIRDLLDK